MSVFKDLKIENEYKISDKGMVFSIDLKKNKLVNSDWVKSIPIKMGDVIETKNKRYRIKHLEFKGDILNSKKHSKIGAIVEILKNNK